MKTNQLLQVLQSQNSIQRRTRIILINEMIIINPKITLRIGYVLNKWCNNSIIFSPKTSRIQFTAKVFLSIISVNAYHTITKLLLLLQTTGRVLPEVKLKILTVKVQSHQRQNLQ